MSDKAARAMRIIACAVFRPALDSLGLEARYPHLRITYLPSHLHLKPQELRNCLEKAVSSARENDERIICLYGDCFPEIDDFCRQEDVCKVRGHYCYEMLLGDERFGRLIDQTAGTYFVEKEFLLNFEEYCVKPLELNDEEMRRSCFAQYRRLFYLRQPSDPDLRPLADEVAEFLGLSLEVGDVDYVHLEKILIALL
ncbi:MAG: DUF1638 domain-containing protein [Dehalococcoidia bacterium]|nr:DUF1638 domain-containing protein [Dehalococcoidia bacterium]